MNQGRNPSTFLRVRNVQKFSDAPLMALRKGKWLNRYITIQFAVAQLGPDARPFLKWFLKQDRDWLAARGSGAMAFACVFESHGGFHVHMLQHVPHGLLDPFGDAEARWIKEGSKRFGGIYDDCVLDDRPVWYYSEYVRGLATERDYLRALRGVVAYLLKGAARMDVAGYLGLDEDDRRLLEEKERPRDQGKVLGRRVSVSHSLLSTGAFELLHPQRGLSWLEEAQLAAEAGRDLHRKTLEIGPKPGKRPKPQPGVSNGAHRRSR
jgi:hypothetical protein